MHRRIHVGAGVLVKGDLVGEEAILRTRKTLPNLYGPESRKDRKLWRKHVCQVVHVSKTVGHLHRLGLRAGRLRRGHWGDRSAESRQKIATRQVLANGFDDRRCAHGW